ncbi:MAG: RHS repeat-associated core domain-containing protein, partial [Firmicutes bacterium]|nr:RHS repeat-associated core domain-containing protein [Bacillota bacterium]
QPGDPPNQSYNMKRFTGQMQEDETSLLYLRARYYDTTLRRFISKDPIGLAGGINPYVYCENSPTNRIYPSGLLSLPPNSIGGGGGGWVQIGTTKGEVQINGTVTFKGPIPIYVWMIPQDPVPGVPVGRAVSDSGSNFHNANEWKKRLAVKYGYKTTKRVVQLRQEALDAQLRNYPKSVAPNGVGNVADAFRHVYWAIAMTREFGAATASEWASAHENTPGQPLKDKLMDTHNNLIGIALGNAQKYSNMSVEELTKYAINHNLVVIYKREKWDNLKGPWIPGEIR